MGTHQQNKMFTKKEDGKAFMADIAEEIDAIMWDDEKNVSTADICWGCIMDATSRRD